MHHGGCHDEDYNFLLDLNMEEVDFDRMVFPMAEGIARPESEGYGYLSGEYTEPSRHLVHPTPVDRRTCKMCSREACVAGASFSRPSFPRPPMPPVVGWPHLHPHPPPPPRGPHGPPRHGPIFKPIYTVNTTLPTLLANHTVNVHVAQFHSILPHGYVTKVFVNGQWVVAPDVPTRNGAVHVVKRLIKPRGHGKHGNGHQVGGDEQQQWVSMFTEDPDLDHEWDDWEEWLPQWANED